MRYILAFQYRMTGREVHVIRRERSARQEREGFQLWVH